MQQKGVQCSASSLSVYFIQVSISKVLIFFWSTKEYGFIAVLFCWSCYNSPFLSRMGLPSAFFAVRWAPDHQRSSKYLVLRFLNVISLESAWNMWWSRIHVLLFVGLDRCSKTLGVPLKYLRKQGSSLLPGDFKHVALKFACQQPLL